MSSITLGLIGLPIGLASGSLLLRVVLCLVGLALPPLLVLVFIPILIIALVIGLLILAALPAGILSGY